MALTVFTYTGAASAHDHEKAQSKSAWVKIAADYKLPEVALVRADGKKISFPEELDNGGRPVILNFIYSTCATTCAVTSHVFAEVQDRLGAEADNVHMVSVSIDPEHDTPARLREFARYYDAGRQWDFYTGSLESSIAVQKAFDAFRGDKMSHQPLTFIRSAPGQPWMRMEGFASPEDIVMEYRMLTK